jgi:hypothetical protein
MENLATVTETVSGYLVKDLTWLPQDGVIRGLVQDPIHGKPTLHNGYVVSTWRRNGKLMPKYGGSDRTDLYLKM